MLLYKDKLNPIALLIAIGNNLNTVERKKDKKVGIKKFIESAKKSLKLNKFKQNGKKESLERLLEKLKSRKEVLDKSIKEKQGKKEERELKEELAIITLQIDKGEKLLHKLSA